MKQNFNNFHVDATHRHHDVVPGDGLLDAGTNFVNGVRIPVETVVFVVVVVIIVVVGLGQVVLVDGLERRRKDVRNVLLRPQVDAAARDLGRML